MNLDDPGTSATVDPQRMGRLIAELPDHCAAAWDTARAALQLPAAYRQPAHVVVLGMGGSAIGADLARGLYLDRLPAPLQVVRSYEPPAYVGPQTLVIACSHSGNTAESLSAFAAAERRGAKLIAITTGGQLADLAQRAGIPLVKYTCPLPAGRQGGAEPTRQAQPRAALGYSFTAVLAVLHAIGWVPEAGADLPAALDAVRSVGTEYAPQRPEATNRAKQLARRLWQRVPIVYGAGWLVEVARRWKAQCNENAKQWAFHEELPELNHNAVEGYRLPAADTAPLTVVSLESGRYPPAIHRRAAITRRVLAERAIPCEVVTVSGPNRLAEVLTAVHVGDWTSYYLALLNGVDPTPVPTLEWLKAELERE